MSHTLVQKTGPVTVTYTLEDSGLLVRTQANRKFSEIAFSFEQLRTNRTTIVKHQVGLLIAFCFTSFVALLAIASNAGSYIGLWIAIASVFGICYFKTRTQVLVVQTTEEVPLEFHAVAREMQAAEAFLELVFAARTVYLISRWGKISPHLEYNGQLENLNWLLSNRIMPKEQYDEKIAELDALFDSQRSKLPFDFSSGSKGPEWN
jgi:hypothetical protein